MALLGSTADHCIVTRAYQHHRSTHCHSQARGLRLGQQHCRRPVLLLPYMPLTSRLIGQEHAWAS